MESTNYKSVFGAMADREKDIKPVPANYETIEVTFSLDELFSEYIDAMMWKIQTSERGSRINKVVNLDEDEISYYLGFILQERIHRCNGVKVNFTLLNSMCVPSFFSTAIAMIGVYEDPIRGFRFVPKCKAEVEYDEEKVQEINQKLWRLRDIIQCVEGAAPRSIQGNSEVMSMACLENHVRSIHEVSHPLMTYFSAFLNAKVAEEIAMRGLYVVQYDNLNTLSTIFKTQGDCLC